jgi:hypothetical protein
MTPAEDTILSADLAKALGWPCIVRAGIVSVATTRGPWFDFDYRDPTVCLPLIEWMATKRQVYLLWNGVNMEYWPFGACETPPIKGKTLPEAVARAVIALKGKT